MRHALTAVLALAAILALAACVDTPKPFAHEQSDAIARPPKQDRTEATIEIPANMPTQMAERVAAAGPAIQLAQSMTFRPWNIPSVIACCPFE